MLRSWVNDVRPPRIRLVTKRVAAGRPTIVARVVDDGRGRRPAVARDRVPRGARRRGAVRPDLGDRDLPAPGAGVGDSEGKDARRHHRVRLPGVQERQLGRRRHPPEHGVQARRDHRRPRPGADVGLPGRESVCRKDRRPAGCASSTKPVRSVRFFVDGKQIAIDRNGASDLFSATWQTRRASAGKHELRAVATDAGGRTIAATRHVRVCR